MNNQLNPLFANILNCHIKSPVHYVPFQIVWNSDKRETFHLILKPDDKPNDVGIKTDEKPIACLYAELKMYDSDRAEFCDTCGYYTENAKDDQGTECDECKYVRRHGRSSDYRS